MATDTLDPTVTGRKLAPWGDLSQILESVDKLQHMSWPQVSASLTAIANLRTNWDGQSADSPAPGVNELAKKFISTARQQGWLAPSFVRATPDGCISFEWARGADLLFEAEVSDTGIEYIESGPGRPTRSHVVAVT